MCIRLFADFGSGTLQNKRPLIPRASGAASAAKSSRSVTRS